MIMIMNYSSNLVMGSSIVSETGEIKCLAVFINNKLTWIPYITCIPKSYKGISMMFKAKKSSKEMAYVIRIYIYPYLIYCIETWGNATNCHNEQLLCSSHSVVGKRARLGNFERAG